MPIIKGAIDEVATCLRNCSDIKAAQVLTGKHLSTLTLKKSLTPMQFKTTPSGVTALSMSVRPPPLNVFAATTHHPSVKAIINVATSAIGEMNSGA
jgi:hypothetical protein